MRCALRAQACWLGHGRATTPRLELSRPQNSYKPKTTQELIQKNKCITKPRKDAYREYRRYRFEQIPEKLQTYDYQIFNNSLKSNKNTTFTWKLVYKDQYGREDTFNIKTKIDSYE